MMTAMGDTTLADTADWPTISAPMMDTVSPTGSGSRRSASCSRPKAISMLNTSTPMEKGTSCLACTTDSSSLVGIIS